MSIETNPPAKGEAIDLLTAESRQRFAESYPEVPHKLQHNLHRHPLLEFERLAQLAEHLAEKGSVEYNLADLPIAVDGKPDRPDMTIGEMIRQVGTAGSWCVLQNIEQDPEYAQLLNDASEVRWVGASDDPHFVPPVGQTTLTLDLPVKKPDVVVPVVELVLKD